MIDLRHNPSFQVNHDTGIILFIDTNISLKSLLGFNSKEPFSLLSLLFIVFFPLLSLQISQNMFLVIANDFHQNLSSNITSETCYVNLSFIVFVETFIQKIWIGEKICTIWRKSHKMNVSIALIAMCCGIRQGVFEAEAEEVVEYLDIYGEDLLGLEDFI